MKIRKRIWESESFSAAHIFTPSCIKHFISILFVHVSSHTEPEHKRVWNIQGTDLLHFKYKRSHRKTRRQQFFLLFLSVPSPLYVSRSEHKYWADMNVKLFFFPSFNDSFKLIKELCLISFKRIRITGCTRRSDTARKRERDPDSFHIVRIRQQISIFKL